LHAPRCTVITTTPASRIRTLNTRPINPAGTLVLYWMIAARRLGWNFALQHAVDFAAALKKPLLILEPLDVTYPWASDRLHRFVLDGMAANVRAAARSGARYVPYVEMAAGDGRGLLAHLAAGASIVVTDYHPAFVVPGLLERGARQSFARFDAVDSNGLIPLADHGRAFTAARSYRAFVQRTLRTHLTRFPEAQPLARLPRAPDRIDLTATLSGRWRAAPAELLAGRRSLNSLPIDHTVLPVAFEGGSPAAERRLDRFLTSGLPRYADEHAHPDADCTSRLSPYLHFGHISAHQVFSALMTRERWTTRKLASRGGGAREGWWGVSPSASLFLDQLVVWRELAFNGCEWIPGYTRADSLPAWARETLALHAHDARRRYEFATLDTASTDDEVWNAAQRQLARDGWVHGYLRMLWGKKILEWAPDPQTALDWMEALMNRYSVDGRDPVSYAGFTWVLGRYDRPWPRRPVFGTVRSMSSASARRKLRMRRFLELYGSATAG
jgi:deoxyribodipyrimidine photo-lyase